MSRWCKIESAECVGIIAVKRGKIYECADPAHKNVGFALRIIEIPNLVNIGSFHKFTLPIIRNIYPQSITAASLVSVQSMTVPASLVFYLKHRYKLKEMPPEFSCNAVYLRDKLYQCCNRKLIKVRHLTLKSEEVITAAISGFIQQLDPNI